eukprot:3232662-Alexandrium_andersonii.AAC.1
MLLPKRVGLLKVWGFVRSGCFYMLGAHTSRDVLVSNAIASRLQTSELWETKGRVFQFGGATGIRRVRGLRATIRNSLD